MPRSRAWTAAAAVLLLALVAIVVRLAWISDDGYITLRTVENWLHGHGPRWNVQERVQTFTHPLWMIVLTVGGYCTGETYFTTIGLGMAATFTAVALWLRQAGGMAVAAAVLAMLIASRAFTEFATSGLENPLVTLLVVLLASSREPGLLRVSLLTALLATTRLDLALLAGPMLLARLRGTPPLAAAARLGLGMLPLCAWLLFAAIYYGSPFPITAYAKAISTGLPAGDLALQGLHYTWYVATEDPATLAVVAAGITVGLGVPALRMRGLAIGALCYCLYVVKVGGDFMAGRFFTPPFAVAVSILVVWLRQSRPLNTVAVLGGALVLAFLPRPPAWTHGPAGDDRPLGGYQGIVDERSFYYPDLGLLSPTREVPTFGKLSAMMQSAMGRDRPIVAVWGQVGRWGYEAGDLVHIVDPWLCDPLLMRLPVLAQHHKDDDHPSGWRIGHFIRDVPAGYLESIATGSDRFAHPGLGRYYQALRSITRDPVFSGERLALLWRFWTGAFDDGLRDFVATQYREPPCERVELHRVATPVPPGTWADDERARIVYRGGVDVVLPAPTQATRVHVSVCGELRYRLRFWRGDEPVGEASIEVSSPVQSLLVPMSTDVTTTAPFDRVRIDMPGMPSTSIAAIAGLRFEGP